MKLTRDQVVEKIEHDTDGWWVILRHGFRVRDEGTHAIVEDRKADALAKLSLVVPCDCTECHHKLRPRGRAKADYTPVCPWCQNTVTVFESGHREYSCTRCKKMFTKHTVAASCTSIDHIYPGHGTGKVRCYCGQRVINRTSTPTLPREQEEVTPMKKNKSIKLVSAKKSSAKAAKSVKVAKPTASRGSALRYTFVKSPKEAPADGTMLAVVLAGIKKIKSGSLVDAAKAAVAAGFAKISKQDPAEKCRVVLRNLANDGCVKIAKAEK